MTTNNMLQRYYLRIGTLLCVFCVITGGILWGYNRHVSNINPLSFVSNNHDFGNLGWHSNAEYSFSFVNTSDRIIRIARVAGSCACTVPTVSSYQIHPGETGRITVRFTPFKLHGSVNKVARVWLEYPRRAYDLHIHAIVTPPVSVYPAIIDFGRVKPGNIITKKVYVIHKGADSFRITDIEPSAKFIQTRLLPASASPPGTSAIAVSLINAPSAALQENIHVQTSLNDDPVIDIPVRVLADSKWLPPNTEFFFGFVALGNRPSRNIIISNLPVKLVKRVWTDLDGATCEIVSQTYRTEPSTSIMLTLHKTKVGQFNNYVFVALDDRSHTILRIPIVGTVQDPFDCNCSPT